MSIVKILVFELLLAFFVGSIPLLVAVKAQGGSDIVSVLAALNPGDPVVIYLGILLVIHLMVWFVKIFFLFEPGASKLVSFMHTFTHQLGFTIHSVYRIVAGAIPMAFMLLLFENGPSKEAVVAGLTSCILMLGCVFMSCFLTWLSNATAPRKKFL